MKLCSACLLGICCRYDGRSKPNKKVLELLKKETLIPICPEQLGGGSTPRPQTELRDGRVYTIEGKDVTEIFRKGAEESYKIAKLHGITEAILKQRSPSCGCGQVYDGSFSGKVTKGNGVTTDYLIKMGLKVICEEDL